MKRKKTGNFLIILLLGALNTITPFSIDMYLPAFPKIAADFHTTVSQVALSVSTYFLGFAAGQILYGPLLDRFGRKKPLYIGLVLYVIATIVCSQAASVNGLMIIRFFQALSGCVAAVAAMAMVRDFFPPERSASVISLLVLILGASPMLAPTAGSLVVSAFGWRYVFITLAIVASLILAAVFFFLPAGRSPDRTISLRPGPIVNGFWSILKKPQFSIFSFAGTFAFSGLFAYVAGSPSIFMGTFHVSAGVFGGIFALLSVGFVGASQLNHILTRHFSSDRILWITSIVQTATAIIFLTCTLNDWCGLGATLVFLFIILSCAGLTYPNAAAIALAPFEKNAGSASALLGFIQIGIGGVISSGVGMLPASGVWPTAMIMAGSALIGFCILLAAGRRVFLPAKAG